jgi:serine/threonine protein kinase
MKKNEVVKFPECADGSETYWTVRLVIISIDSGNGKKNLVVLFRFISEALKKLYDWPQKTRVQFKMPIPMRVQDESKIDSVKKPYGENVTVIHYKNNCAARVFKEFCYHLREESNTVVPLFIIEKENQRHPPPKELLNALGSPYTDWTVHKGPFGIKVLCYDFINGDSNNPSIKGWLEILELVNSMHEINFVHGDLLPRNVLFDERKGYVIDFDLSRKEDTPYVKGFNYDSFQEYRHADAKERKPMKKEHDLHSLRKMSNEFFVLTSHNIDVAATMKELIQFFRDHEHDIVAIFFSKRVNQQPAALHDNNIEYFKVTFFCQKQALEL